VRIAGARPLNYDNQTRETAVTGTLRKSGVLKANSANSARTSAGKKATRP
jgi:hypothetical protein